MTFVEWPNNKISFFYKYLRVMVVEKWALELKLNESKCLLSSYN